MIAPQLVFDPTTRQVARAIVSGRAYLFKSVSSIDEMYVWKSGIRAPVYTDCRILNGDPGARAIIQRALGDSIRANFPEATLVAGVAEAGIVWSTLAASELGMAHCFVRKSKKEHGPNRGLVECSPIPGSKVVLVDDLVASGISLCEAADKLRNEKGMLVLGVQSIVNWDFMEMRKALRVANLKARALVSFPQVLDAAFDAGIVSANAREELLNFYGNPTCHAWNFDSLSPVCSKREAS